MIIVIGVILILLVLLVFLVVMLSTKLIVIKLNRIMATQAEIAQGLREATTALQEIGASVEKVGAETDTLIQKIKDLEDALNNQANASPELVEAFNAVKAQVDVVRAGVTAVDDKVPDATPPPPPEPTA